MTQRPFRAVLYLRLSVSADDSTSIARQERDLRTLADREGWEVVAIFTDDGMSGGKRREQADAALDMLAAEDADVLAVWAFDRWSRQGHRALADLQDVLDGREEAGRPALFATVDGMRSDEDSWDVLSGVNAGMSRSERRKIRRRARSAIEYRRTVSDRFTGGASVPFGYRSEPAPDRNGRVLVVDSREAEVVRSVADRLLDGVEPLSKVAADLTRRGIPTSKSAARRAARKGEPTEGLDRGRWTASTIRSLWTSDSLLGRVVHRGDLVRDSDGLPRTVWEPVLDASTLERLRVRLGTAPRHAATTPPKRERQTRRARLLSGVAFCALCDSKMYATTSGGRAIYSCGSGWNGGECPGVKIGADALDQHVSEAVLTVLGTAPEMRVERNASNAEATAALADVEAALREASAAMLDDDSDVAALGARISTLKAQRARLRAVPSTVETVTVPTGRSIAEAYAASEDVDWRRSVLLWGLDHVAIAPATARGMSPLDPARITYYWNS